MKAIVQKAPGGPHTLEVGEVEMPVPKENQFLIKIAYTTVNRADTMQVTYHLSKVIEDRKLSPSCWSKSYHWAWMPRIHNQRSRKGFSRWEIQAKPSSYGTSSWWWLCLVCLREQRPHYPSSKDLFQVGRCCCDSWSLVDGFLTSRHDRSS